MVYFHLFWLGVGDLLARIFTVFTMQFMRALIAQRRRGRLAD
jgi:hypothetical protein